MTRGKPVVYGSVMLCNDMGLHVRPTVRVFRLITQYRSGVEIGRSPDGPWVSARSPALLARLKLKRGETMYIKAEGDDGNEVIEALIDLVEKEL